MVVALGGNALLKRGESLTAANQRARVRSACRALAPVAHEHELVIAHGNGPQAALLGAKASAYTAAEAFPLDILGAQVEGMIGYMIERELGNELPPNVRLATVLTITEVDAEDPTFHDPKKSIGPLYREDEAAQLEDEKGWTFKADGAGFRRVVPSPMPKRIFAVPTIRVLLDHGCVVICGGGGGIATQYVDDAVPAGRRLVGAEAVIDKDLASGLLAIELDADVLALATDVDAAYADWGTSRQRPIRRATPEALASVGFAGGSMGPKVRAASRFVEETGRFAVIGSIRDSPALIRGEAGTVVALDAIGLETVGAR